jgi:hypothetical protein
MTEAHRLTDERLAWLAATPSCEQRAAKRSRGWLSVALSVFGMAPAAERGEWYRDAMADYGIAVDDLSRKLTADERAALRSSNVLPDWFLPAVDQRFTEIRAWRKS